MKPGKSQGPIETVTVKGSSVAIYWTPTTKSGTSYPGHTLSYTEAGKRKRRFITKLDKAREAAKEIARQLSEGTGHVHSLSPQEVADYASARQQLRKYPDLTLAGVVAEYVRSLEILGSRAIVTACEEYKKSQDRITGFTPAMLPDVYAEFLAQLETADASQRYVQDCRSRMGRAAAAFRCHIHAITTPDLSAWLAGLKVAPRTKKNMRTALVTLFAYAKQQGHLPRDRQTEAELLPARQRMNSTKKNAAIGIYTPADLAKILNAAPADLLPVFAIAAFAGVRTAEIHRLRWSDIKADHIVVGEDQAKTASRRIIPILPPLAAWLKKSPKVEKSERIAKKYSHGSAFTRAMSAATKAAGVEPVHNGFRHSFCTYRLADTQNAAQVALEAGNSPTMLFRHYRELATPSAAKKWFSVCARPAECQPCGQKD